MPSHSAPVTPSNAYKKNFVELDENPLRGAFDRSLRTKCSRMKEFIAEHGHELHLYINTLRHFASSPGGLVLDEIRAEVWPVLAKYLFADSNRNFDWSETEFESALSHFAEDETDLDASTTEIIVKPNREDLMLHAEWNQIEMDVQRTLARFPPNISDADRECLQTELTPLIVRSLLTCPIFRYYQGFHDVCLTLLLVLGVDKAEAVCVNLVKKGVFGGYLSRSLEDSVMCELDLMYVLLWKVDSEIERLMRSLNLGAIFALSWPLTWFSHAFHHYSQIVVCFDLFLASHPLMPIYYSCAVVLWRSSSILCSVREMPVVHNLLNNMPDEAPIQALVADAQDLFKIAPPPALRGRLLKSYKLLLNKKETFGLPMPNIRKWFLAGSATAVVYILSRYMYTTI